MKQKGLALFVVLSIIATVSIIGGVGTAVIKGDQTTQIQPDK